MLVASVSFAAALLLIPALAIPGQESSTDETLDLKAIGKAAVEGTDILGIPAMEGGERRLQGDVKSMRMMRLLGIGGEGVQSYVQMGVNAITLISYLIFAMAYYSMVVKKHPRLQQQPASQQTDFETELCACCSECQTCLHAFFCGSCRAAHTWQVAGATDYWVGVFLLTCLPCLSCCIGMYFRGQLHERLGRKPNPGMDCLVWLPCLSCFAAGQEALEVDNKTGAQVSCCCKIELSSRTQPNVVGQAVGVK